MLLNQLSGSDGQGSENPGMRSAALLNMLQEVPYLNLAQFYPVSGNADSLRKGDAITGAGENRAIGSGYTAHVSQNNDVTATLRVIGDRLQTDQAIERRGGNVASKRAQDFNTLARSIARHLFNQIMNGDNTGQNLNGLKNLVPAGQKLDIAQNGLVISYGNSDTAKKSQQLIVAKIEELLGKLNGPATMLIMDLQLIQRLRAIARDHFVTASVTDAFGQPWRMETFAGIPVIPSGFAADGSTRIIPFTETVGSSNDCGSIYAVRCGEGENWTHPTNVGVTVKDHGLVGTNYETTLELDVANMLQNDFAVAKLQGLRID